MQSSPEPAFVSTFTPLPLRVRGVLEILDVSVKAFKQYFWVLVGWSALVNLANSIPLVNYVAYLFAPPLIAGAACCCIAAAVRGQSVSFKQCWQFTEPRYWSMVAMHVVSLIIAFVTWLVLIVGLVMAWAYTASSLSPAFEALPDSARFIVAVVGFLLMFTVFGLLMTMLLAWHTMVGVVVCMEEDKRNAGALGRAWNLLKGHWRPVIVLMMLLGMGVLVLWAVLAGTGAALIGLPRLHDMMEGRVSEAFWWQAAISFGFGSWLLFSLYVPIHYLASTLLYLDLRIRKEALDLEWTAHTTAPTEPVFSGTTPQNAPLDQWTTHGPGEPATAWAANAPTYVPPPDTPVSPATAAGTTAPLNVPPRIDAPDAPPMSPTVADDLPPFRPGAPTQPLIDVPPTGTSSAVPNVVDVAPAAGEVEAPVQDANPKPAPRW